MERDDHAGRIERLCLPALALVLPFEPRTPTLPLLGFQTTVLEAAAGVVGLILLWSCRRRLWRRPGWPVALLLLYALAHVLSAGRAPVHPDLAARFSARMVVMAGFALLVSVADRQAHRLALGALAASGVLVAALAVLEGSGVRRLDPFLDHFRGLPTSVAGARRATAGSEYPNLAAAFLMAALLAGGGLALARARPWPWLVPFALLLSFGLLYTYSRGALVAGGVGLLAMAAPGARRDSRRMVVPLSILFLLLGSSALFAWGGEAFRLRLTSEGTSEWYGAVYAPQEATLTLGAGELKRSTVRVINAGRKAWPASEVHLSHHWYDLDRRVALEGERTSLPHDLAPGEAADLEAVVRAPERDGRYLLYWDMVHENTVWFSEQGVPPAAVAVRVGTPTEAREAAPGPASATAPARWQPGRSELWALALRLWREHPLTGVGSDNFRWCYGPAAGRSLWDTRVFANNTLLEAAATTGTLGALCLAATLATSLVLAGRAAIGAGAEAAWAACLFGLLAAVAVHGLFDYVLAFTGHYLLLGLLVGAITALPAGGGLR